MDSMLLACIGPRLLSWLLPPCHWGAQTGGTTAELSCPLETGISIIRFRWAGLLGFSCSYSATLTLCFCRSSAVGNDSFGGIVGPGAGTSLEATSAWMHFSVQALLLESAALQRPLLSHEGMSTAAQKSLDEL